MEVYCDNCEEEFAIKLRENKATKGKEWLFVCPYCEKRYDVATKHDK